MIKGKFYFIATSICLCVLGIGVYTSCSANKHKTDNQETTYHNSSIDNYKYTSQNNSTTYKESREPIANCKRSNPVDCAIHHVKDNYDTKQYGTIKSVRTTQNYNNNDYIVDYVLEDDKAVINTFRVVIDKDSKYIYDCYIK